MSGFQRAAGIAWVVVLVLPCRAQTPATNDPAVAPATAVEANAPVGQRIHFQQQPAQLGDRVVQRVGVDLELTTKIVQSGQVAHEGANRLRRQQQRTIDVLEATDGRAVKSRVAFEFSRRQAPDAPNPDELVVQPIEGKTYLAERRGDQLLVTDPAGAIPPRDEYLLAMESLDSVGKPNPLAEMLAGRSVTVGEHRHVPREMARSLLNMDNDVGTIKRFELTLVRQAADKASGAPLAVFQAHIEVTPDEHSPLAVQLAGEMAVDPASCRLVALDLAGPVGISTIERSAAGIYQFSASGQLQLAMRAQFSSDKK
jgi:hypothetical protein